MNSTEQPAQITNGYRDVVMYGASGQSVSIDTIFRQNSRKVVAFLDDFAGGKGAFLVGRPVISFEQWVKDYQHCAMIVVVADPSARRALVKKSLEAGAFFDNYHARPDLSFTGVTIDDGSYVSPLADVGFNTQIGNHVQVMPMVWIGHDVVLADFVTICSGSIISGNVVVEEEVFIGTGVTVINGTVKKPLVIGRGAVVSAGSVVTKSVPAGTRVFGNPARSAAEHRRRLRTERKGR